MNPRISLLIEELAAGGQAHSWGEWRNELLWLHLTAVNEEDRTAVIEAHRLLATLVSQRYPEDRDYASICRVHQAEYLRFLIDESTIDGTLDFSQLDRVTKREVSAGRLAAVNSLRVLAIIGNGVMPIPT